MWEKELKRSFIYRIGHTTSGFHIPLGYGNSPMVSIHQGLTLHLFSERQKMEVGSLFLVYFVNLLHYEFKTRSAGPLN